VLQVVDRKKNVNRRNGETGHPNLTHVEITTASAAQHLFAINSTNGKHRLARRERRYVSNERLVIR